MGDGSRLESGRAMSLEGSTPSPSSTTESPSCIGARCPPAERVALRAWGFDSPALRDGAAPRALPVCPCRTVAKFAGLSHRKRRFKSAQGHRRHSRPLRSGAERRSHMPEVTVQLGQGARLATHDAQVNGTGRHPGLRNRGPRGRAGSSPALSTHAGRAGQRRGRRSTGGRWLGMPEMGVRLPSTPLVVVRAPRRCPRSRRAPRRSPSGS